MTGFPSSRIPPLGIFSSPNQSPLRTILGGIATRRSVFVSYHHGNDQVYYDEFSRLYADTYGIIQDRSLDRLIDSNNTDYVMRRIRENRITGTSCTLVLCGQETPWRKYVDWEIKATLDKQHGLIGVNLPTNPKNGQGNVYVPNRLFDNVNSGYAVWTSWEDVLRGPEMLKVHIEDAVTRPPKSIKNQQPLMSRNGTSLWRS